MLRRRHARSPAPALALLAMVASACGDARAGARSEALPLWGIEPELRIGSVDDPDYAFTSVGALEVGSDGSLYSLHRQEATVRRWTPDGLPAGTIGRKGEGPGEFDGPRAMGWLGDTLWVLDGRNYRVSFFGADGTFLRDVTPKVDLGTREQALASVYPPRPASLLEDGTLHGVTPGFSQDIVEGKLTRIAHVRMSLGGETLDTLAVLPTGPGSVLGILRDGGGTFTSQPFRDDVTAVLSSGNAGLLVLERRAAQAPGPAEFRLTRIGLGGDTVFSRAYPYDPVPLPRERVDSAVEAQAESLQGWLGERMGTTRAQWAGWIREAIHAPPHLAPVEQMLAGRDGTIWLGLNPAGPDGRAWMVLDEGGEPLGTVLTPDGLRVLVADRERVWGVERDALDVEYVVRYAVVVP